VRVIAETAKDIANILEDVYIEARICHAFPGVFRTGILLNNLRFPELVPSIQKQIADEYHGFAIMQNLIVQYCKTGDINNLGGYTGEYLDSLYDCVPVIDNAVYDDDVNVRYNAANIITIKLWQYIKPLIDKVTKEGKNKSGSLDRLIEGLADELNKQTVSSGKQPSGNGKPVRGNLKKYDKSAVESAKELLRKALGNETAKNGDSETDCDNNTIQEVTDDETERIKPEKTDSIDEGSDGSVIRNDSYDGAGYESAANDTERLLGKIAEEKIQKSLEDELTAELQTEADNIRYGNAHIGVNITVNRINPVNDKLIEQYNSISQPLLLLSKRMQDQISQILQNKLNGGKMTGLYMGRHIKSSHIFRNDGRIFYNTRLPEDSLDIAVALLVDESASMGGRDRITSARAASIVIYDFCVKLGIPVIVYGHSTSYGTRDVELYAYAEFDSYDMKDKYRIMDMSARSSNRDGAALRFVAERLMTRSEDIKLLILTSDGQPSAIGYTGTAAEDDLRSIKREYTNKGVTVFNAAIGDDKENIERIYGRGYLDITDLNKLPVNLTSLISSHIK
ncbi:MAG: nitric oxide reductase activation protein NorD, partial [Oscillospiraceae bacterium]|nr:nitric oxide reductase activation protein NorD [Oscillospiraceae bacterium]